LRQQSSRFVLKSPLHTTRIPQLLELFPEAFFVHLTRNPFEVYASTLRMRRAMIRLNSLSRGEPIDLEEQVLADYMSMYNAFHMQKALIDRGRLLEIRYEDLVADPVVVTEGIYDQFRLKGFEGIRPRIEAGLGDHRRYRTSTGPLS